MQQLALIARQGLSWFRSVGVRDEPGTMLISLSGTRIASVFGFAAEGSGPTADPVSGCPAIVVVLVVSDHGERFAYPGRPLLADFGGGDVTLDQRIFADCDNPSAAARALRA